MAGKYAIKCKRAENKLMGSVFGQTGGRIEMKRCIKTPDTT
jgi:hypothetical protein